MDDAQVPQSQAGASFRLIHAALLDGSDEILCTNLPNEYSEEELSELYFRRRGIEVSHNFLKNRVQLENLSGITYNAFMQEMYASLIMANLCGAYCCDNKDYECDAGAVPKIKLRPVRNKANKQAGGQHKGRSGDDTGDEARNEACDEACEPTEYNCDGRLKSNRRTNMATVLSAIRSILPQVLFCSHGSLARIVHKIDVPCLKTFCAMIQRAGIVSECCDCANRGAASNPRLGLRHDLGFS